MDTVPTEPWSHTLHYHRVVLGAIPAGCSRPRHRCVPAYQPPIVWPPPMTYGQTRRLAGQLLPGVRYRRHLYWRYSLTWVRPSRRSAAQRPAPRPRPPPAASGCLGS
jgi:hypothetical protein